MKHFRWLLVLVACFSLCCMSPRVPRAAHPAVSLHFHADDDFTAHERKLLARAADNLRAQSGGLVDVTYTYDLTEGPKPPQDEWWLAREDSISLAFQLQDPRLIYGLTVPAVTQMVLVYDRLGSDEQFVHTAMHEMLHAIGVPHLAEKCQAGQEACTTIFGAGAVMANGASWSDGYMAPQCMNLADRKAVASVLHRTLAEVPGCS